MQQAKTDDTAGAVAAADGTRFRVWAPASSSVDVMVERNGSDEPHALERGDDGWFHAHLEHVVPGDRYRLRLDGNETWPDPLSRFQPDGVHGASQVVDSAFPWTDHGWRGVPLEDLVIHEVHVGTATPQGTFDALIERLPYFVDLGVTALELMPVSEFPGFRNWGYDGVYLFAPARAYGGPDGLRRLVDAAHAHGLAVILDVVYNHFGPEGNYLPAVTGGRIFTEKHHTPWGAAVNYDDEGADAVRSIVLDNVRHWIRDFHIDGLRLDAAHAIVDSSDTHILQHIAEAARVDGRHTVVIAEDETNERTLLLPADEGGYGLDGVWADDAHHILRRMLAGDDEGYYAAYRGTAAELARAIRRGWLFQGETYAPTGEPRGTSADGIPAPRFVHCIQNHDQVGNRALGERLNHQIELPAYRAASALLLLSPNTPLLWMGQEWAASSPFLYFTDHPEELGRLVTQGRREEFKRFSAFADEKLRDRIPDPQAPETFERSRLDWSELHRQPHAGVLALYRELLHLRRTHPALRARDREHWQVDAVAAGAVALRYSARGQGQDLVLVCNLTGESDVDAADVAMAQGQAWTTLLWTEEARFGGEGKGTGAGGTGAWAVVLQAAGG